ncbi:hypothetical protein [Wolbachia endosymbiont (group A) of Scambus nigricans]|uniref:hypothetical protein n=1 Tax=Wolbachia endosymbiont (group A) of Scambus nigricans TaxID=2954055 RepID=UPI0022309ACA|nr:hypothetical protein [Wolbachia endosymbiont (group A) of Scambus nigricans]
MKQVREERDRLLSENRLLRSNKNEKSSQAISSGRKLSNYASACFILLGVFIALFTIIRTDRNMLLACYSHKHISYRIRTIIRKVILLLHV